MLSKNNFRLLRRALVRPAPRIWLVILAVASLVWAALFFYNSPVPDEYWPGLFVEYSGAMFDITVIGLFFSVIISYFDCKQEENRQHEIIEDYKCWDSEEAQFRLAGAIRRLNKMRVYKMDFLGIRLTDFSFSENGIKSLAHSTIYNGSWGDLFSKNEATLKKVKFDHIDCHSVVFSVDNLFGGIDGVHDCALPVKFTDCTFSHANLRNAIFNGARLEWSEPPPDSHYVVDDEEYGDSTSVRISDGPFTGSDLAGASFEYVIFDKVDFRDAENILDACFFGAQGLENAIFDTKEIKDAILEKNRKAAANLFN